MKDEERFLADLSASRQAVNRFAGMLRSRGINAWLPPEQTRPDASVRRDYSDAGDLMLQMRVEHKVRHNLTWTCREDFPWPTVIIDEVYNFDQKLSCGPPLAYVIENSGRTHAAVVYYAITRPHWQVKTLYDQAQNRACDFYVVDKRWVRFCPVENVFDPSDNQP